MSRFVVSFVAAAFISSAALAQSTDPNNNFNYIQKFGVNASHRLAQEGTNHNAYIYQDQVNSGVDNPLDYIDPISDGTPMTSNLYGRIFQGGFSDKGGDANAAALIQAGNRNVGLIYQDGVNNRVDMNQAYSTSTNHFAEAAQTGTGNKATTTQASGNGAETRISQVGASNTATTTQYSTNSNASITQSGTGNTSEVYQVGNNTSASNTQIGNNNSFYVENVRDNQLVKVTQQGDNNSVSSLMYGNSTRSANATSDADADLVVNQSGNGNTFRNFVEHATTNNRVNVNQRGGVVGVFGPGTVWGPGTTYDASKTNLAYAFNYSSTSGNRTTINQEGAGLTARANFVSASNSRSTINQVLPRDAFNKVNGISYMNNASTNQNWGTNLTASIQQSNESNRGYINQWGNNHSASLTQSGPRNYALLEQRNNNQNASVVQAGDAGYTTISQTASPAGTSNTATGFHEAGSKTTTGFVYQNGRGNKAGYTLKGTNSSAMIQQVGDNNEGVISAKTSSDFSAYNSVRTRKSGSSVQQAGNGNKATITDNGTSNNKLVYDYAQHVISQTGNDNVAGIDIKNGAKNNIAAIVQSGNSNTAYQTVQGRENALYISQYGSGNTASQDIKGNNNNLNIYQEGNNNTGSINWQGNNNNLNISQYGNGLSYAINGSGNSIPMNITQRN